MTETSLKRYKYVGKERDEETGLYYYGARYYAAWLCRFVSVDPLQHKYPHYTPYQYAGNKPVSYIDLDGLEEAVPNRNSIPEFNRFSISSNTSENVKNSFIRALKILEYTNPELLNKVQKHQLNISLSTTDIFSTKEKNQIEKQFQISGNTFSDTSKFRAVMATNQVTYKYNLPNLEIKAIFDTKGEKVGGVITAKPYGEKASQYWNDSIKSINDFPDIEYSLEELMQHVTFDTNIEIAVDIVNFNKEINYRDLRIAKLLAHEIGEALFKIENPDKGYLWNEIGDPLLGGHDKYNPVGKAAENQETIFERNKKTINWDEINK